jgi:hypothetical protein
VAEQMRGRGEVKQDDAREREGDDVMGALPLWHELDDSGHFCHLAIGLEHHRAGPTLIGDRRAA